MSGSAERQPGARAERPARAADSDRSSLRHAAAMHVVLDARMAWHSGIGRYVRGLGRELTRQDPGLKLTLLVDPGASSEPWSDLPVTLEPYPAEIYSLREQWLGSWICRRRAWSGALFHFPHYNAPWLLPPRSVVTVHDLTHLELPEQFPRARVRAAG